ncbi:MAG: hypothetical protein R6V03_08070 [Kiritimatiellia bacterium]
MFDHVKAGVSGEALFWFLVVVVTIIAQIAKAVKKDGRPAGDEPASGGGESSPADELEDFLKSLNRKPQTRPAGTAPKPRRAQPARYSARLRNQPAPPPVPAAPPPSAALSVPRAAGRIPRRQMFEEKRKTGGTRRKSSDLRSQIIGMLKNPSSVRGAVMLREVLGPATALRTHSRQMIYR